MSKALVIGSHPNQSHDETVRNYFLTASPSAWTCDLAMLGSSTVSGSNIANFNNISDIVQHAIDNDYKIIIRSYTSMNSYKLEWANAVDNGIMVFHAHGANSYTRLTSPPNLLKGAVAVGGGLTANQLSYGPGLEMFDLPADNSLAESWTTPTLAGKFAEIIDAYPLENVYDHRQRLRQSGSFYYTGWIEDGGYGRDLNSYAGDLELSPPLELSISKSADSRYVTFNWSNYLQSDFGSTQIVNETDNEVIYSTTSTTASSYVWQSSVSGDKTFSFQTVSLDGSLTSDNQLHSLFNVTALKKWEIPYNTLISTYCGGTSLYGIYADGYGGTFDRLIDDKSISCGYRGPAHYQPTRGVIIKTNVVTVSENLKNVNDVFKSADSLYREDNSGRFTISFLYNLTTNLEKYTNYNLSIYNIKKYE